MDANTRAYLLQRLDAVLSKRANAPTLEIALSLKRQYDALHKMLHESP